MVKHYNTSCSTGTIVGLPFLGTFLDFDASATFGAVNKFKQISEVVKNFLSFISLLAEKVKG